MCGIAGLFKPDGASEADEGVAEGEKASALQSLNAAKSVAEAAVLVRARAAGSSAQSSRKPHIARPTKSSRPMPTRKTLRSETRSQVSPCATKSEMVTTCAQGGRPQPRRTAAPQPHHAASPPWPAVAPLLVSRGLGLRLGIG